MNTFHLSLPLRTFLLFVAAMLLWLGGGGSGVLSAEATSTTPILVLTVNGGSSAVVVNNESVELGWYVDGPVTNCVLIQNNSVAGQSTLTTINTASLPTSGTMTVLPPEDSTTSFILNCDGLIDVAPVNVDNPVVTLSLPQGIDRTVDPLTGGVFNLKVAWTSTNATRCDRVRYEKLSAPGVYYTANPPYAGVQNFSGDKQPTGYVEFDGWPLPQITESTTFYITCYNDNTGAADTDSITVNINYPPPPGPISANIWSIDPVSLVATQDQISGYAYVDLAYNSNNATACSIRTYYDNGVLYNSGNYFTESYMTSNVMYDKRIGTTTVFEVYCTRAAVTLAGVTYPAVSASDTVRIALVPPTFVPEGEVWDRTTVPAVTVSIVSTPNPTTKNALTGYGTTYATVNRNYATYCNLKAYGINGTPGNYADDVLYTLSNWTGRVSGSGGVFNRSLSLSTSTRLYAYCYREYDLAYGTADEIENGTEITNYEVLLLEADEPAPPPRLYLYGNASSSNSVKMWTTATEKLGFNYQGGGFIENTALGTTTNKITFPFKHPFGKDDKYDVWLKYCDESDGVSTYNFYTENNGLVGTFESDLNTDPAITWCGISGAWKYKRIALNTQLDDGDLVTVECLSRNDGERCTIGETYFGAVGNLIAPEVNPVVTSVGIPIFVIAENATYCGGSGELGHWAYPISAARYSWWGTKTQTYFDNSSHTLSLVNTPISTSTRFTLTCWRTGDNLTDFEEFNVYVPFKATLSAETTVGVGQCIDDGTFGNFGVQMNAPAGYGPDEDGFCSPMVDLAAVSPAVSVAGATEDNVNGTYDDLDALIVIQNLGPGGLPADSGISYKAILTPMAVFMLPDIETSVGTFNDELVAPATGGVTQSSVLTRSFDGVPFGTHTFCARINLDGSPNYPESSNDPANNSSCTTVTLPVPRPPMTISTDRDLIRTKQSVDVDWGVNVTYQLLCTVRGPGGLNESFDTLDVGPAYTSSFTTAALSSTVEFEIQCTEPITNTVFTERKRVEMVPDVEEI